MMAKVIWKAAKTDSGMLPEILSKSSPDRNILPRLPTHEPSPENASEYPATTHNIDIKQATAK